MTNNFFTLIVPDNMVSNLKPIANKININFLKTQMKKKEYKNYSMNIEMELWIQVNMVL